MELVCARIAARAHGVVTRVELLGAGVTTRQVEERLGSGFLLREYPGVYRVGHRAPSVEARYMAAVKACGEEAVLCGRAAAYLLGIVTGGPPLPEVTAVNQRRIKGIRTRRERHPLPRNIGAMTWQGIPVTTPARTLVELAAVLPKEALARACHEAGVRHRTTPAQVEAVLALRPNSPGAGQLRAVLRGDTPVTLSKLERRFLQHVREIERPLPETNRLVGSKRVDCRWPEHGLTVELDSYTYHRSRHAWEQDRRRDREAYARGDQLRRYTYDDVFKHPGPMLAELRRLLPSVM